MTNYNPISEKQPNISDVSVRLQAEASQRLAGLAIAEPLLVLDAVNMIGLETLQDVRARGFIETLQLKRDELEACPDLEDRVITLMLNSPDYLDLLAWHAKVVEDNDIREAGALIDQACQEIQEQINTRSGLKKAARKIAQINGEEITDPSRELKSWADLDALIGPIEWDWKHWLPQGLLAVLASESGTGKSALMLRIAGTYTLRWPWPDGKPFEGEPGIVLWCEAEAAQAINLERAKKWGISLDRLKSPLDNLMEDFKLDNPAHKGALASAAFRPDVRLIAIDSLSGADRKAEKSTEDSSNIGWLAELARDSGKPILISHHLRKRSIFDSDKVDLERLRGSSSIVQPARIIWALDVPDPQAENWKRLAVIKSNLAKFPDPIGMTITDQGIKFGLAPEIPKTETIADRAIDLLLALLQDEPKTARTIETEFDQAGISIATMKRAKDKLGIISIKDKDGWKWSLPARGEYDN